MRKIKVAIVTIMIVMVMGISSLFGCSLVTTNNARDLSQVVATVQINENAPKDVIYKRDLITAYMNNYQYQGAELTQDTLDGILSSLINNRVLIQFALDEMDNNYAKPSDWNDLSKYNEYLENFLSDLEELDAKYSTYKSVDDLIDSYAEEDEEEKRQDTFDGTARVVPTGATNDDDVTDTEKQEFIDNFSVADRMAAFTDAINALKDNDLLGDEYDNNDITKTDYFKKTLKANLEAKVVEVYTNSIITEARAKVSYQDVQAEYERIYNNQKQAAIKESGAEFGALVDSISASSPILYGRNGYGMVYHVLLKADDDMLAEMTEFEKTPNLKEEQIAEKRNQVFANITVTDLRSSWIAQGYDFDGEKFTGDYALCEDSIPFGGTVTLLNGADKEDKDYKAEYRVEDTTKMSYNEFIAFVNEYLYDGTATTLDNVTYTATTVKDNFDDRIKELMFAFSQDDSDTALNAYKGYAIKPEKDNVTNSWAEEFALTGRELINASENTFKIAATNYGYHIMFFSESFASYDYPTLESYLDKEFKMSEGVTTWEAELKEMLKDWDEYENTNNYLYVLHGNLATNIANKQFSITEQKIINDYVNNTELVVRYPEVYKDLIEG
ncbi:MAG: hypothetical protein E7348_00270 [Clostridiales bacterium]|nr:hypothetical protein [Clostridiales bacterium]